MTSAFLLSDATVEIRSLQARRRCSIHELRVGTRITMAGTEHVFKDLLRGDCSQCLGGFADSRHISQNFRFSFVQPTRR